MYRYGVEGGRGVSLLYYRHTAVLILLYLAWVISIFCRSNLFVQEDEDDEYEEEKSLMEDTMDQSGIESDDKRIHQVGPLHFNYMKCF